MRFTLFRLQRKRVPVINKFLIQLLILLFFSGLQSAYGFSISIFPINLENRFVQTNSKEYKFIPLSNFSFSIGHQSHQVLIEHTEFEKSSGNETLNFLEINQEYHLNYLYQVTSLFQGQSQFQTKNQSNMFFLYMGIGTGVYNSSVKTQYLAVESIENSGNAIFISGLVSLQFQYSYVHSQLDLRLFQAKDYSPQPQPGVIWRAGIKF